VSLVELKRKQLEKGTWCSTSRAEQCSTRTAGKRLNDGGINKSDWSQEVPAATDHREISVVSDGAPGHSPRRLVKKKGWAKKKKLDHPRSEGEDTNLKSPSHEKMAQTHTKEFWLGNLPASYSMFGGGRPKSDVSPESTDWHTNRECRTRKFAQVSNTEIVESRRTR